MMTLTGYNVVIVALNIIIIMMIYIISIVNIVYFITVLSVLGLQVAAMSTTDELMYRSSKVLDG